MDDHKLPLDLTVYGAIHQHELRKHKASGSPFMPSMIWQGIYSIKFKKVPGPLPLSDGEPTPCLFCSRIGCLCRRSARTDETGIRSRSPSPSLSSLPEDAPHAKILRLLRMLHKLNVQESERATPLIAKRILPSSAFVNNKLSAKLTRQLEEPMIVARYDQCFLKHSVVTERYSVVPVYLTGLSTSHNTSPSYSHSQPVTTSSNRPRSATHVLSSSGRANKAAGKTAPDVMMAWASSAACSARRLGYLASTSSSPRSRYSSYTGRRHQSLRSSTSRRSGQAWVRRWSSIPSSRRSLRERT